MWLIVVLLGIVIILYASLLPKAPKRAVAAPEDFLDSVGDTLQHFADEIEEENKELLRMVGEMKREHESRTSTLLARIEQLEKRSAPGPAPAAAAEAGEAAAGTPPAAPSSVGGPSAAAPVFAPTPIPASSVHPEPSIDVRSKAEPAARVEAPPAPLPIEEAPAPAPSRFAHTVKERYRELFDMYEGGKSIEYIAKKLGKNKGEVQLIIGLARQEERPHGQS